MENKKVRTKLERKAKFYKVAWNQMSREDREAFGFVAAVLSAFVWWVAVVVF